MKTILKISGIILGIIILLMIIGGFLAIRFTDLNTFKPMIAAQIKKITGRTLTINGDINWSLYPVLGLDFKHTTLSNLSAFGDQPFIKADDVRIGVRLLPLLSRRIEIERIVANGLVINLLKNRQGVVNWQMPTVKSVDIKQTKPTMSDKPALTQQVAALKLVDIKNVTINWQDLQTGRKSRIDQLSLQANDIFAGEFFPIKLSLNVKSNKPSVIGTINSSGKCKISTWHKQYQLRNFILTVKLHGKDVPQGKLDAQLKSDMIVTGNEVKTSGLNLILNGDRVTGNLDAIGINKIAAFDFGSIIRPLNIKGELQSKRLRFAGMDLRNAKFNLQGQNGVIKAPFVANMYGGGLQVNTQINVQKAIPNIAVQYKYSNFNLTALANSMYSVKNISGTGDIWGNVTTRSFGGPKVISTLYGTTNFKLSNGVIQGIDVAYLIYQGRRFWYSIVDMLQKDRSGQDDAHRRAALKPRKNTKQTRFSSITGANKIINGIAHGSLSINSPDVQGGGSGTIDLVRRYLNYKVQVSLKGDLSDWAVPIIISGPFGSVKPKLDKAALNKMAQQRVKQALQKRLQQQIKQNIKQLPIKIPKLF